MLVKNGVKKNLHLNDNTPESSRRHLLKHAGAMVIGAAGVSALPNQWTRPIVDTLLLPAHAQTTQICLGANDFSLRSSIGQAEIALVSQGLAVKREQSFTIELVKAATNAGTPTVSLPRDYDFVLEGGRSDLFEIEGKLPKGMKVGESATVTVSIRGGFECDDENVTFTTKLRTRVGEDQCLSFERDVSMRCLDGPVLCEDDPNQECECEVSAPDLTGEIFVDPRIFDFERQDQIKDFYLKNQSNYDLQNVELSFLPDQFSAFYSIVDAGGNPAATSRGTLSAGGVEVFYIKFTKTFDCPADKPVSILRVAGDFEWICPPEESVERGNFETTVNVAAQNCHLISFEG